MKNKQLVSLIKQLEDSDGFFVTVTRLEGEMLYTDYVMENFRLGDVQQCLIAAEDLVKETTKKAKKDDRVF